MPRAPLALVALLTCAAARAQDRPAPPDPPQQPAAATLLGPTVGHVGPDRALLWLRAEGVRTLEVRVDEGAPREVPFDPVGRGFGALPVEGLTPSTTHTVAVALPGGTPAGEVTFRTAPPAGPSGRVRFGVGSCAAYDVQPVWQAVRAADLDLFLWLGDNTYYRRARDGSGADWDGIEAMLARQLAARTTPGVLEAMQRMACYAVWDDHDYGPNNSDRHFPLRAESRLVHRYLWAANPGFGEEGEGVYFTFRRGPVAFFLLDGRSFKDCRADLPVEARQLYGARQLGWLQRELLASDAPLKVIAGGVQQLLGYGPAEGWHQAPAERAGFLSWLARQDLGPLLFLSGDIHVSELYRVELGDGRVAFELTSSGLAQRNRFSDVFELLGREERRWFVARENFCVVDVDVPPDPARRAEATVRFACLGVDGAVLQETDATFADFGVAPAPATPPGPGVAPHRRSF